MKHGSLFSGIGGFDLAAEWMGWENMFHCEKDKFCQKILKHYWPNAKSYGDIKTTDFTIWGGIIDIISGGDPCQPHSVAGLGKGTSDDRFLWPEMFRAVRESQPFAVVNENVDGSISNGVLDLKIDDLESIGYTCQAYSIPAETVGALHQRERIWLVAYNHNIRRYNKKSGSIYRTEEKERALEGEQHKVHFFGEPVDLRVADPNPDPERSQKLNAAEVAKVQQEGLSRYFGFGPDAHGNFTRNEIESGIIRMLNGLPEGMDYTERNQRIKALGNAIVPQVAYQIFKAIEEYEIKTQCQE